jgi:predicted glutamine amidotransferase
MSVEHELLEAPNPLIRQSEVHDSGWGMASYETADGNEPRVTRYPRAAFQDGDFVEATRREARIFNVHVRRATMGGLSLENTHPFCLGNYSFSHNGTVIDFPKLMEPGMRRPAGQTDSEHLFWFLMHRFDPGDVTGSLRRAVEGVIERSNFSAVNFLFSDGECLYAYKLGIFELHWLARGDRLMVSTEKLTDEEWHPVRQDVLLTLDPSRPEEPLCQRLVGDEAVAAARIEKYEEGAELRGAARGEFASERAEKLLAG